MMCFKPPHLSVTAMYLSLKICYKQRHCLLKVSSTNILTLLRVSIYCDEDEDVSKRAQILAKVILMFRTILPVYLFIVHMWS